MGMKCSLSCSKRTSSWIGKPQSAVAVVVLIRSGEIVRAIFDCSLRPHVNIKFLLPELNRLFNETMDTFWLDMCINKWQNGIDRGQNRFIQKEEEIHEKEKFCQNGHDIRVLSLNHCQNLIRMMMKVEPETLFNFRLFTG